jgi:hypothetical protein
MQHHTLADGHVITKPSRRAANAHDPAVNSGFSDYAA